MAASPHARNGLSGAVPGLPIPSRLASTRSRALVAHPDEHASMKCGVVKETYPGERRVALVPAVLATLAKAGMTVMIEAGAGRGGRDFADQAYRDQGATIVPRREEVFAAATCRRSGPGAGGQLRGRHHGPGAGARAGKTMIAFCDPLGRARSTAAILGPRRHRVLRWR